MMALTFALGSAYKAVPSTLGTAPGDNFDSVAVGAAAGCTCSGGDVCAVSPVSGTRTIPSVLLIGAQRSAGIPGGRSGALLLRASVKPDTASSVMASPISTLMALNSAFALALIERRTSFALLLRIRKPRQKGLPARRQAVPNRGRPSSGTRHVGSDR